MALWGESNAPRAGGNSPAALVFGWISFSQDKNIIPFLQKGNNKQNVSMIFGLVRLITLSYNRQKKHSKRCYIIGCPCIMHEIFCCAKT